MTRSMSSSAVVLYSCYPTDSVPWFPMTKTYHTYSFSFDFVLFVTKFLYFRFFFFVRLFVWWFVIVIGIGIVDVVVVVVFMRQDHKFSHIQVAGQIFISFSPKRNSHATNAINANKIETLLIRPSIILSKWFIYLNYTKQTTLFSLFSLFVFILLLLGSNLSLKCKFIRFYLSIYRSM